MGGVEESDFAAAALAKNWISIGQVRRRTMPMVYVCYGGCVVRLTSLAVLREERVSNKLQIGSFLREFVVFWV